VGAAFLCAAIAVAGSTATGATNPFGLTTITQRIVPDGAPGFDQLAVAPGEGYVVREDGFGSGQPGRAKRRVSLAYFGQLSDFQLADEESPARVEFVDPAGSPVEAAFRPWEALQAFIDDAMIRQIDTFAGAAPVAAGDGSRDGMDFTIDTGDSADNQQLNETRWVRTLLEGGTLDPNSGIDPSGYAPGGAPHPLCPPVGVPGAAEAAKYTGVQDYGDYVEGPSPYFYDPDEPRGAAAGWPAYPGLMDRAQQSFPAAGLSMPSYVVFGNHDALAQGNQAANGGFEQVATGCIKPTADVPGVLEGLGDLTPATLLGLLGSSAATLVPPDPNRRYVSKAQYKQVFLEGSQPDGHGFADIDPAQNAASGGVAGYYSFVPVPGLRMIALDTICEGGVTGPCADGNIDDPQFRWLEGELKEATAADQLVVLFSHHAIPSLTANVPDEAAPACTAPDAHGHDVNPGCDADPRLSTPIHLGADMVELLHRYPHVIAWVAGHSHVNDVTAYPDGKGHGFWSIRVAAEADWPQQSRLLQIFDNRDGTLSLFGTILDHASEATAPAPGTNASTMTPADLASIGRTLSYNDDQTGGRACAPDPCGEGGPEDRNVELLVSDPRRSSVPISGRGTKKPSGKDGCSNRVAGTRKGEALRGTPASDLLLGRGGNDRIRGRAGEDCIFAGRGNDRVYARGGGADSIRCGRGHSDIAYVDPHDSVKSCERIRRGRPGRS
jgi:metallophosphoesterase (TIGR03767 family)